MLLLYTITTTTGLRKDHLRHLTAQNLYVSGAPTGGGAYNATTYAIVEFRGKVPGKGTGKGEA